MDDDDLFCDRVYGPKGWTAPFLAVIESWFMPGYYDDRAEFYGVPQVVMDQLLEQLIVLCNQGITTQDEYLFDDAVRLGQRAPGVVYDGVLFFPERSDERLEVTSVWLNAEAISALGVQATKQLITDALEGDMGVEERRHRAGIKLFPPRER